MDDDEAEHLEQDSYYAILNVPKDASEEDIKKSYRNLAQVCHPDKAPSADSREEATANFMRIQEAYEVLVNEEKRVIYDVYGLQGLHSGLDVGESLRNPSDLKKEFERFKAKQMEDRQESSVAHRGVYIFKVDACELMNPYDSDVDHMPELISVATTNSVQMPLSDTFAASVGCQVAVRKKVGGGSFVCGIKRILSPHDTVECHAAVGLKTFVSVQSTRRFSDHDSATLAGSWAPRAGFGLSLTASRQLSPSTEADWTWQVGPDSVMGLGISRRGEKWLLSGRLEVGAATGIIGKFVWQVMASTSLRAAAKFGTMGIELELGGSQQVSEFSTAGCSVVAGLQGIILRPRFSRGGHTFEVPILLSPTVTEYKLLLAAYVVPPLAVFVTKYYVIKPLRRRAKIKKGLEKRMQHVREVQAALQAAAGAARVMEPVAKRKLKKEVEKDGLVVVSAKYGAAEAIRLAEQQERHGQQNGPPQAEASTSQAAAEPSPPHSRRFTPRSPGEESEEDEETAASVEQAVSAAISELPPAWLDITTAVRFMVSDSNLQFHKGVSKSGLMGFCDAAPGEDKVLVIHYLWHGWPHAATISDRTGGCLPKDGNLLTAEDELAVHICGLAQEQKLIGPHQ